MKYLTIIFCLFLSAKALAQTDTPAINHGEKTFSLKKADPLVVLDGVIFNGAFDTLNPDDILTISVLKGVAATNLYGTEASNGVVLITTKMAAIKSYQKKLSTYSASYKTYVATASTDTTLMYTLNGNNLPKGTAQTTQKLYDLHSAKIKSVVFNKNNHTVTITTYSQQ